MRQGAELPRGLVEADVAVGADSQDLNVDTTGVGDRSLVTVALLIQVRRRAVQKVDVLGWNASRTEEMRLHELPVAAGVRTIEPDELIQIEGPYLRQIRLATRDE